MRRKVISVQCNTTDNNDSQDLHAYYEQQNYVFLRKKTIAVLSHFASEHHMYFLLKVNIVISLIIDCIFHCVNRSIELPTGDWAIEIWSLVLVSFFRKEVDLILERLKGSGR